MVFTTEEEYLYGFKKELKNLDHLSKEEKLYLKKQIARLDELLDSLTKETFWTVLPEILGIDSKLAAFVDLVNHETFSSNEIIQIIEKDYRYYTKELCGYNLISEPKHSLIFNVV